jgi:ligand-binding sensor domain-containing protein/signal transduction histidine kinase
MKKLSLLFISALVFLLSFLPAISQNARFTPVVLPENNKTTSVLGMTQDAQGFMWMATQFGLYKYDGYQYTAFHPDPSNPNSLLSNHIECIAASRDGAIWIGFYKSAMGVQRFDPTTNTFTRYRHLDNDPNSLSDNNVSVIMEDSQGNIWFGTNGGLNELIAKENRFVRFTHKANEGNSLSYDHVRSVYEDKQGTIWVGTGNAWEDPKNEGGLNKLDLSSGTFTRYLHDEKNPQSLIDNHVRVIFEDSHNNFWIGTGGDGLHTMDRRNGIFERHLFNPKHTDALSRPPLQNTINYGVDQIDHITFINEDLKGNIWIGTLEGGINEYDPQNHKVVHYGKETSSKQGIEDNNFFTAYKTRDGLLWLGAWASNLYKVKPYEMNPPYQRLGENIYAVSEDDQHTLWFGTNKGLISKDVSGRQQQFLISKDLSTQFNRILCIEKDDQKGLWIGTFHGLYHFDPVSGTFKNYDQLSKENLNLSSDTIKNIAKDPKQSLLWLGTNKGLKSVDPNTGKSATFSYNPSDSASISNNIVEKIIIDKNGNLWVCTANGLNRFDPSHNNFKKYLSQLFVGCVLEDKEGDLWATTNKGIYKFDSQADNFINFIDESGMITPSMDASWITEDHNKNLWLNTQKGVLKLNLPSKETVLYSKNQGLQMLPLFNSGFTRATGEVIYGDTAGYYCFNSSQVRQDAVPPVVKITNFSFGNTAIQENASTKPLNGGAGVDKLKLKYNENTFSFQFYAIDFVSAHEDARVNYMLESYDNTWHRAGDERSASYFHVPPGNYTFRVRATNSFGVSAESTFQMIIMPPWYQTWWAYCVFGILFAAIIWSFITYRSKQLKKENKRLEEKVTHRTAQLVESLESLKSTQSQLIQSEKMASLGMLTSGIAHEIQNPLNFVNNFSELNTELITEMKIKLEKGSREDLMSIANIIEENEEKITHHGKRADAIVKHMLQHAQTKTGEKLAIDINALADQYLRSSYRNALVKENSLNVTLRTEFDESIGKITIPQDIGLVLLNIFNNAFYAVSEKKKSANENYIPAVSLSTRKSGEKIFISVTDNGNGIPQNILDKVFQPFFTTKPPGQGIGLGLSLSYEIMKSNRGQIKIKTNNSSETSFIIELPLVKEYPSVVPSKEQHISRERISEMR